MIPKRPVTATLMSSTVRYTVPISSWQPCQDSGGGGRLGTLTVSNKYIVQPTGLVVGVESSVGVGVRH